MKGDTTGDDRDLHQRWSQSSGTESIILTTTEELNKVGSDYDGLTGW